MQEERGAPVRGTSRGQQGPAGPAGRPGPGRAGRAGRPEGRQGDPGAGLASVNELDGKGCTTLRRSGRARRGLCLGDRPDHAHLRDRRVAASAAERQRAPRHQRGRLRPGRRRHRRLRRDREHRHGRRRPRRDRARARQRRRRHRVRAQGPHGHARGRGAGLSSRSTRRTAPPTASRSSTPARAPCSTRSATRARSRPPRSAAKTFDLVEGTLLPVDVADSNTVDGTLARIPDGADADNAAADWAFTTTPDAGGGQREDVVGARESPSSGASWGVSRGRETPRRAHLPFIRIRSRPS